MTNQQNSPSAGNFASVDVNPGRRPAKTSERVAELDAELRDLVESRHEIGDEALAVGVACWGAAVERELGRLEFPRGEIDELLQARMSGLATELNIIPRPLKARRI